MATIKQAKAKLVRTYKNIDSIKSRIADLENELEELDKALADAQSNNRQAHEHLKAVRAEQDPEGVTFAVHGTQSDSCKIQFMSVSFETFNDACRAVVGKELPSNMSPKEIFKIPNSPKAGRKQSLATHDINSKWKFKKAASNFMQDLAKSKKVEAKAKSSTKYDLKNLNHPPKFLNLLADAIDRFDSSGARERLDIHLKNSIKTGVRNDKAFSTEVYVEAVRECYDSYINRGEIVKIDSPRREIKKLLEEVFKQVTGYSLVSNMQTVITHAQHLNSSIYGDTPLYFHCPASYKKESK